MNPTYTLIMIVAVAAAGYLSRRTQQSMGLSVGERIGLGLGAFSGAMIGAKLPFVLSDWPAMLDGTAWFSNGKTIMCGLVGGYIGVLVAKWTMQLNVKTGDSYAVPVAVGIGVGRLACFSAGCCHGTPTSLPWGVVFEIRDALPRHPTQLYEAAFHFTAAVVLYVLLRRGLFRGQLIKLYFIAYFVYRLLSEFIRPEPQMWLSLTAYQWGCLVLIPTFIALWLWDIRSGKLDKRQDLAPASE